MKLFFDNIIEAFNHLHLDYNDPKIMKEFFDHTKIKLLIVPLDDGSKAIVIDYSCVDNKTEWDWVSH